MVLICFDGNQENFKEAYMVLCGDFAVIMGFNKGEKDFTDHFC